MGAELRVLEKKRIIIIEAMQCEARGAFGARDQSCEARMLLAYIYEQIIKCARAMDFVISYRMRDCTAMLANLCYTNRVVLICR